MPSFLDVRYFETGTFNSTFDPQLMNPSDIGLIGLAVMGENLVLNMESKGFSVSVYNRTTEVTEKFAANRGAGQKDFGDQVD